MNEARQLPSQALMKRRMRGVGAMLAFGAVLLLSASALALRSGERAPEIGLRDLNGRVVNLASLRGKVVLVDFWASWCEPCAEEMPVLERLYSQYRSQGFVVVGVAQDRDVANVRTFLQRRRVSFPIVHDGAHAVAGRYRPASMPSSFIIDRNGVVRFVHAGFRAGDAQRMEREVQSLLRTR